MSSQIPEATATAVTYELREGIGLISLDDGKVNALTYDVVDQVAVAFARAEAESQAIVIAGRPGVLTAGFDLNEVRRGVDQARAIIRHGGNLFARVVACPKPVVVACTGHAVAGGAVLLLAGDVRIGSQGDFTIGLNEVRIGIGLPDFVIRIGEYRLARRHCERALLGQLFDPAGALEAGFLDQVVAQTDVLAAAMATARDLASHSAHAYAATKTAVRDGLADADWSIR